MNETFQSVSSCQAVGERSITSLKGFNSQPTFYTGETESVLFVKRNRHFTGVQKKIKNTDSFCLVFELLEKKENSVFFLFDLLFF